MLLTYHPSRILVQLLIDAGLCSRGDGSTQWGAYYEGHNDLPDDLISIVGTQGRVDSEDQYGNVNEHFAFQLLVRGADPEAAHTKIQTLRDALHRVYQRVVTITPRTGTGKTYVVHNVSGSSAVLPLGVDRPNSSRSLFTWNAYVLIEER